MTVIDAHQHFWDLSLGKHPWLCREPWIHMRYGDYSSIRRDYMPADYLADATDFDVAKTVYVEAEWDPNDPCGEVDWVKQIMDTHGYPNAVVAQAWLDADNVDEVIATHAAAGVVRSVRHKPTVTHSPHVPGGFARGSMSDGARALRCSHPMACTLTCRWCTGTWRKRRNLRVIFRTRPSSSITRRYPPIARRQGSTSGAVRCKWPPNSRTWC